MRSAHLSLYGATLADLEERYRALKGSQPASTVAAGMGVSPQTLQRYERNGIAGIMALASIATWVEHQETHLRQHAIQRLSTQQGA